MFVQGQDVAPAAPAMEPAEISRQLRELADQAMRLAEQAAPAPPMSADAAEAMTRLDLFHDLIGVFIVAFLMTLLTTPIMRILALKFGVVDRPSEARKIHRIPIAYLGGVAVYLGIIGGVAFAYATPFHGLIKALGIGAPASHVPLSVLLGMTVIMLAGLIDDVSGISPRVKIGLQLFAAAALALDNVGVRVASGVIMPLAKLMGVEPIAIDGVQTIGIILPMGIPFDVVYWVGTVIIAVAVLGACNASNLIDGLDGLLSGVTAIAMAGLLIIALSVAVTDQGSRDVPRIVLCLAVMGACLGFLPHNFNPANIFLGDTGSMLLGFCTIVVILSLGDEPTRTPLVVAGLIIYAVPLIDTALAIVRRKMAGKRISDPDDQHLHHMLKRALGVKGAAFALYSIGAGFAALGVLMSEGRARVTYVATLVLLCFIGVISFKIARKAQHEKQAIEFMEKEKARAMNGSASAAGTPTAAS